jgi:hypothetical protein
VDRHRFDASPNLDLDMDLHQNGNSDPDRHQYDADPQHCSVVRRKGETASNLDLWIKINQYHLFSSTDLHPLFLLLAVHLYHLDALGVRKGQHRMDKIAYGQPEYTGPTAHTLT